jgi:EAL domain-containing protein (putative c-di-GMP-specific phosphodiesterase class I)/GGDEF domain-containing protein
VFNAGKAFLKRPALGQRRRSLSGKLQLVVVASVMAAVLVIAIGALVQEAQRHTQGKVAYLQATAAAFASAASHAVAERDQREALNALRGIGRATGIVYARIDDADKAALAELGFGVSLDSDARYDMGEGAPHGFWQALTSNSIEVSEPIVQGGLLVGRITLVADNADLWPRLLETLLQTLLGAAAALCVAALIAARLQQWIVRPLLRLTGIVRHISASHDYKARVDIETDDEVGDLCGGFNTMLGEIQDRERKIMDLAEHDAETDLPNRLAFERAITERLAARRSVLVIAVGVDRFQYVRGVIGYHHANDLLGELGARAVMFGPMAARISTDSIGILADAATEDAARTLAQKVVSEMEQPMLLGPNPIEAHVRVGLALAGVHANDPQALIERATIALDQARAGQSKVAVFDDERYQATAANLTLMTDMMRALENGEMRIALQPKYDVRSGTVRAAEVLARWTHPARGNVRPDVFVNMAEETGAIGPLTDWVLATTIAAQKRLRAAGIDVALAVNLSGRLVSDVDFIQGALAALKEAEGEIYMEITETASIEDEELSLRHINALIEAGAKISIDDYGQGLSSLAYLKRIPANELKIDKAFIESLEHSTRDALLVKSTIDLAHSLGMKVTAEGVENETTLAALKRMGCDRIQGYYIGKPMPEAEFAERYAPKLEAAAI